ncbi:MAG TPA: ABC transporter substrate-binding protein [Thermomicrobiales bacterium]|nr:ABC transporter substrate-binding protein [Thermomicrobiales bacterium]
MFAGTDEELTMGTGALVWRRVLTMAIVPAVLGMSAVAGAAQEATPSAEVFGDDGVLTNCVDPSFPPMEYFENQEAQEPIGFDIDLINAVGERLGVEVEHIPSDFTGLLPALEAGRCDVVASGIYLTAERLETFDAQPYYDTSVILLTPADNADITSPEDLAGKTVAVQAGTNYINILNDLNAELQAAGQPGIDIQSYPDQTDAIQQLVVGRADATITQDTEAAFRETAQPGQFKIAYTYPEAETFGIYFRQGSEQMAATLAETVEGMRDDGTLAEIAEIWNLPVEGTDFSTEVPSATPEATPAA